MSLSWNLFDSHSACGTKLRTKTLLLLSLPLSLSFISFYFVSFISDESWHTVQGGRLHREAALCYTVHEHIWRNSSRGCCDQIWFSWEVFSPASNNLSTLNSICTDSEQQKDLKAAWERLKKKKQPLRRDGNQVINTHVHSKSHIWHSLLHPPDSFPENWLNSRMIFSFGIQLPFAACVSRKTLCSINVWRLPQRKGVRSDLIIWLSICNQAKWARWR